MTDDCEVSRPGVVHRRTVLRWGGLAAAGASVAALAPVDRAAAANAAGTTTSTFNEAFGGVIVQPRSLERWLSSRKTVRQVVCVGDSITQGTVGGFDYEHGGSGCWVERLATAMDRAIGPIIGFGFRGVWLGAEAESDTEWQAVGTWTRTKTSDSFDVCPFGDGLHSNGGASATLTWTKPTGVTVAGFELYWFFMPGAGNWQYSVDGGTWVNMGQNLASPDSKLHMFYVPQAVKTRVQIRAYDGSALCQTPIAGISVWAQDPRTHPGIIVHNLGRDDFLLDYFVRSNSHGDPLAWLDSVVSNPGSLAIRPDLLIVMFSNDVMLNNTTLWQSDLVKLVQRVAAYADVLLISPYEQSGRNTTVQANYRAATKAVAATHGCGLLDLYDAYGAAGDTGWQAANNDGLMYDSLHPSQRGHDDISARTWRMLRTLS